MRDQCVLRTNIFLGSVGVCFVPDSFALLSWSMDGTIKVWDARNLTLLHSFLGHRAGVLDVAIG